MSNSELAAALEQFDAVQERFLQGVSTLLPPHANTEHPNCTPDTWPLMDQAAYYGLAGEFTKAVEPYSEADPVGILLHTLIGAACLIGSGPYVLVEHAKHPPRLNALLVGRTAGGRKGTDAGCSAERPDAGKC